MKAYIALVEWDDAYFCQTIVAPETIKEVGPYTVQSVGWVLSRNKKDIRIACSQINDGRVRDILVIPTPMIRRVKRLR